MLLYFSVLLLIMAEIWYLNEKKYFCCFLLTESNLYKNFFVSLMMINLTGKNHFRRFKYLNLPTFLTVPSKTHFIILNYILPKNFQS